MSHLTSLPVCTTLLAVSTGRPCECRCAGSKPPTMHMDMVLLLLLLSVLSLASVGYDLNSDNEVDVG
jgi:hypothetical protein